MVARELAHAAAGERDNLDRACAGAGCDNLRRREWRFREGETMMNYSLLLAASLLVFTGAVSSNAQEAPANSMMRPGQPYGGGGIMG
jgi:hypothetical protein